MKTAKILVAMVLLMFASIELHAQSWVTNGLVAYYPFNGNANDASGNGNNGTNNGAILAKDRYGSDGNAFYFNATNLSTIICPSAAFPIGTNDRTISVWIKPNSAPSNSYFGNSKAIGYGIVNNSNGSFFLSINWQPSLNLTLPITNEMTYGMASDNFGYYKDIYNSDFSKWHQVVLGIQNNTNYFFYFDGVNLGFGGSAGNVSSYQTVASSFYIGSFLNAYFNGGIDDIRIYNRALSSTEVQQLYALEAPPLPTITTQPQSITTNLAANVSFTVSATGTNGVWYQWQKDGVNLPNATNSAYNITNVQPPYIGNYDVVVTGYGGSITSSVASLSISNVNSGIWQGLVAYYPFNGNANDSSPFGNNGVVSNASLSANQFGSSSGCYSFTPSLHSQISITPTNFPSGTNPMTVSFWMQLINPTLPGGGAFEKYPIFCVEQDSQDSWNLNLIYQGDGITITPNTEIFTNGVYQGGYSDWSLYSSFPAATNWHNFMLEFTPSNTCMFILDGRMITPTPVSITNYFRPQGTWFIGGAVPYPGGTYFSGKLDAFRIYNRVLSPTDVANLYASEAVPPTIAQQPITQIVNAYDSPYFTVTANGSSPLTYQWRMNGTNIPNATNSSYSIASATQSSLGSYSVVVTNVAGSVTSRSATLYMNPYIATPFSGAVAYWGQSATLGVTAWGSGLNYQWYFNGNLVSGATGSTYSMPSIQMTNAGMYSVVVSSIFGSATNTAAQVTVNPAGVSLSLNPDLVISGTVGYSYIIQSSTNLANTNSWITLTNLILSQPVQYWDDTSVQWSQSQRYYRVLPGQ